MRWPGFCALLAVVMACHAEFQVNTYTNEHQYHPAIAMNQQGEFLVLWRSAAQDGGVWGLYGQRYDAQGNPLHKPRIGGEFKINTTACFHLSTWWPSAALHSSGSFVVVWTQRDPITYYGNVVARMYDANGTPLTGEFFVNTNDLYHQGEASVAMNDSGDFVIVWQSWHGNPADPYSGYWVTGRLYDASGTPKGDEFVITQLQQGRYADVVMDNSGDFVVAWLRTGDSSDPPMGEFIRFRRYNADGTPKDDAVQITDDIGGDFKSKKPSIAMDGDGNFVIAWGADFSEHDVYAQPFDPYGTPVSSSWLVNTYTDSYQGCASVAMNKEGKSVIVWKSTNQDGSDMGIFGQRYDSEGTRIDEEFQVNTYTQGRQWLPRVAMSQNGRFVTVWQDEDGHDGDGYGIFGEFGEFPKRIITVDDDGPADFNSIQPAIDFTGDGDTIIVQPGLYDEDINFLGKNITLRSANPGDPNVVPATIIHGAVVFEGTEGPDCILTGFNIDGSIMGFDPLIDPNGENHTHAAISHCLLQGNGTCGGTVIRACDGTISNCVITDNFTICLSLMPVVRECLGPIKNCTIANNNSGVGVAEGGSTTIQNCIIYYNWEYRPQISLGAGATLNISYCDLQSGLEGIYLEDSNCAVSWGPGNIDTDPCFVQVGYWDEQLNQPIEGDYHLQSQGGRWDPNPPSAGTWVQDDVTSPCIDAADPRIPIESEPFPNGGIVNVGAYGGTAEASKSYFDKPPCEIIVAGDINGDCKVDFKDFCIMALHWLRDNNK